MELEMSGAPVSATCVYPGGIKTNIARASKLHPSMADIGIGDLEQARKNFEVGLRLNPDEAAEIILRGVQKNALRVLVGVDAHIIDWVQRLLPDRYHSVIMRTSYRVLQWNGATKQAPKAAPKRPISASFN
jgi:short-subunit dehydrogenase